MPFFNLFKKRTPSAVTQTMPQTEPINQVPPAECKNVVIDIYNELNAELTSNLTKYHTTSLSVVLSHEPMFMFQFTIISLLLLAFPTKFELDKVVKEGFSFSWMKPESNSQFPVLYEILSTDSYRKSISAILYENRNVAKLAGQQQQQLRGGSIEKQKNRKKTKKINKTKKTYRK
jgi:hypothetical protein